MARRKLFVVAGMHGDEPFTLVIAGKLLEIGSTKVDVRIGNPEALASGVRYIQTDMNRSFLMSKSSSKEARLATSLQKQIAKSNPDLIIDMHTSISNVPKVAILAQDSKKLRSIASKLGMDAVVIMPTSIAQKSLIGQYPSMSMSLEFGIEHRSSKLASQIAKSITALKISGPPPNDLPVYKVIRKIESTEARGTRLENLEYNKDIGGYPFLVGKGTYPDFKGFLAKKL